MKIISSSIIIVIKLYKFFISPFFPMSCRYLPTCSDFFIENIKLNGALKGTILGIRRILKCHPVKILGGGDGFDPVVNLNKKKK